MKLILVRHGQTDANMAGIIQGHGDSQLTLLGKRQAQKIAQALQSEKIHIAYCSDLTRTRETAEAILKFHPLVELLQSKELREVSAGKHEGRPIKREPKIKEHFFNHFHTYKPEGGESFVEAQERIATFYETLLKKHQGKTILLVSHGGILGALLLALLKKPICWEEYDKHRPQNAALSIIEIDETKEHKVHLLNCMDHLHEIESHNLAEE